MAAAGDQQAWTRLGEMLGSRRVDIDTRYANLTLFTQERGVDYRLAWDIEHGARDNYRRPTLAAIEIAYQLEPRSIEAFIADGTPLVTANPYLGDPDLAKVWDASRGLKLEERHGLVKLARDMRSKGRNGGRQQQPRRKQA